MLRLAVDTAVAVKRKRQELRAWRWLDASRIERINAVEIPS